MGMRSPLLVLAVLGLLLLSSLATLPAGAGEERSDRATSDLPVTHRPFKMGVGPHPRNLPSPSWDDIQEGYAMAGQWGEVVNYWPEVPWYGEEAKLVGNATTAATIKALYTDNGLVPVFQTNFWTVGVRPGYGMGAWLQVPPDLDPNITMADATFRSRWVDHVRSIAEEWQMEYYCLGNEVNSYHGWHVENAADFEANLPSLMAASYAAIKEVSPDTQVVLTFRLLELYHFDNLDLLELFDGTMCDVIAFTSYPSRTGDYATPADLPADYYHRIVDHTGTIPLAIAELGWTSHAAFGGDEDEQAEFLLWFLEHTRDIPWEYVQWLELHDLRPEGVATAHSQTVGLRRNDGTAKPVWEVWTDTFNLTYTGDDPLRPRGPIHIDGDDEFDLAHGVSSGNGSVADPYVIEGWSINGSEAGYCIIIANTTARFLVRDCLLRGSQGDDGTLGVSLVNASWGEFTDNTLRTLAMGIHLDTDSSDNLFYRNNIIMCDSYASDQGADNLFSLPGGPGNFWGDAIGMFGVATHDGSEWNTGYSIDGPSMTEDEHPAVNIFDHDLIPLEDHTRLRVTTGDVVRLTLFSPVTDEMRAVVVYYLLDDRRSFILMEAMEAAWGSLWGADLEVPSDATGQLAYLFSVEEMDGNTTISNISSRDVVDDIPPWLVEDATIREAEVGGDLLFEVELADNIGVAGAWVEHWMTGGTPVNDTMESLVSGRWTHAITVGAGTGPLRYVFHFVDAAGNLNSTGEALVSVGDATPPAFGENLTVAGAVTGETVVFSISITDDVGLANVTVEFGDITFGLYRNETMNATGDGDLFEYEFTIPGYFVGTVLYRFWANDTSGNLAHTDIGGIIVEDVEVPTFQVVAALPPQVDTGGRYEVSVNADDNVGMWSVTLFMSLDTGEGDPVESSQNLLSAGTSWSTFVFIDTDHLGTITYHFRVVDLYDNAVSSEEGTSSIVDTIPPEMEYLVPVTAKVGQRVRVEVEATDNIGVAEVRWRGLPFKAEGLVANGTIGEPGTYRVTVTVVDAAGNEAWEEFTIFVEDDTSPAWVLLQAVLVLVLVVVALLLVKWFLDQRRRQRGKDPELEAPPED